MYNSLPKQVRIVDVGPRDGLQNEPGFISLDSKVALVRGLVAAGVTKIEAGSFVNPQWVPQMADSEAVFAELFRDATITAASQESAPTHHSRFTALTPNLKGMQRALAAGVKEVAVFAAATETFSQRNINCSIDTSLERFVPIMSLAGEHQIPVRGYISCALGCPYEGDVKEEHVESLTRRLLDMGCYEVSLGDTIGVATPQKITSLINHLKKSVSVEKLALHLHDTYGQAIANIYAGLQAGIATYDASIAGLGGCPFAKGASGNVATEDVVYLLNGLGIKHGINLEHLIAVGTKICQDLGKPYTAKAGLAILAKNLRG